MASLFQLAFTLLVCFQIKHFICDFPLQNQWMIRFKTANSLQFVLPLSAHCLIHAAFCLAIILYFEPSMWWMAGVDFLAHFLMDRVKSSPNMLGRYNDQEKPAFWNALGFDQMVHHFTSYYIIWSIIQQRISNGV